MKLFEDFRHALQMFAVCASATALDFLSSLKIRPPHEESNPFARHMDGSFWPWHAFIANAAVSVEYVFLSAMFYVAARPLGEKVARVAIGLPWLYLAYGHIDAACWNILYSWPNLYVETTRDMLQKLLGQ